MNDVIINFQNLLITNSTLKKSFIPIIQSIFGNKRKIQLMGEKLIEIIEYFQGKNLYQEKMSAIAAIWLKQFYKDDILKLQNLIGRDLSQWLV